MKVAPLFTGAAVLAACAGAAIGMTVPTEPIAFAGDPLAEIPEHQVSHAAFEPKRSGPNHYPLKTPQGTIEVHELSDHGLYRNRRNAFAGGEYLAEDVGSDFSYASQFERESRQLDARWERNATVEHEEGLPVVAQPSEVLVIDTHSADSAPLEAEPVSQGSEPLKPEPRIASLNVARPALN